MNPNSAQRACCFAIFPFRFETRVFVVAFFVVACLSALAPQAGAQSTVPEIPSVEGPVTGPGQMYPGLRPLTPGTEPADYGYVTEEFFVSGTTLVGGVEQPYTTRMLVRQPKNPKRFSGIVVAEVMHSNGFAVTFEPSRHSFLLRGHIHVEIAAQLGNVTGVVKPFNPERYAPLVMTSGAQTSQIVAQVGALIKSNLRGGPLHPLRVRHLLLMGTSQSSGVLRTYQSQQHFQARMPDGGPIVDGYLAVSTLGGAPMMVVDVPTIMMPTQTEVNSGAAAGNTYRRPDSDEPANRLRIYETAGMPHANGRDTVAYTPGMCTLPVSDFPWGAAVSVGLHHLVQWVDRGRIPPRAPYIEVDNDLANDGSRLALDANGNVKGGVRNVYVDVPVAQFGVPNAGATPAAGFLCSIAGFRLDYDEQKLQTLYRNRLDYLGDVTRRALELVFEGWLLPESLPDVLLDALETDIPRRSHP
jgi:Alpha/beta hydrolase domain